MSRLEIVQTPSPRARRGPMALENKPALVSGVVGMGARIARVWMLGNAMPRPRARAAPLGSTRRTVCPS
jgi:hypothetical protein